jgi:DNA polymerase-3 subunit delta
MATPAPTFEGIRRQIANAQPAPLYVLHGAEGYYIDELVKDFEALVPESERDFNLYVLYATQTSPDVVVDACLRYPMMAERQVVILKEAQAASAAFMDGLAAYAAKPNPTTVLVIAARGDKAKGAKFMKAAKAGNAVIFETKKLYESQVAPFVSLHIKAAGLNVDAKALAMIVDHVGTDLSRIINEVEKVKVALPSGATVTPQVVEKLIGVSKDFNTFELIDALMQRNAAKAYRIAEYFRQNPKNNPTVPVVSMIFNQFAKLLMAWYAPDHSDSSIAAVTGARYPSALTQIKQGMRAYNARQVINAISACRRCDTRSKGIGSRSDPYDLLRELIFTILN